MCISYHIILNCQYFFEIILIFFYTIPKCIKIAGKTGFPAGFLAFVCPDKTLGLVLQAEDVVSCVNSLLNFLLVDQNGYTDLRGRDHLDVDV